MFQKRIQFTADDIRKLGLYPYNSKDGIVTHFKFNHADSDVIDISELPKILNKLNRQAFT